MKTTQVVVVMTNETRDKLSTLLKQLKLHGAGGGSPELWKAMGAFGAPSMHHLAVQLAEMLLRVSVTLGSSFGGGGGVCGVGSIGVEPYRHAGGSGTDLHAGGGCGPAVGATGTNGTYGGGLDIGAGGGGADKRPVPRSA